MTAVVADVRPAAAIELKEIPIIVAVLDVQQIMRDSKAAVGIQAELQRQRAAYQAELAQQENALLAADQDLAGQRATLSQEQYKQKREALDQQAMQLRRNVQGRKDELEELFNNSINQVRQALAQVVAEIAQEKGITLVLSKSQVVLSATGFDITADTLTKLDAKLPSVAVAKPK
ncbi:MAG: OmpH family outer membrane protein [Dongiaceae bacterium]